MTIDETKFRQIISRLKTSNEETAKELEALLPLSFPEPPAGYTWHNGLNCTPEQVGIDRGWRLVTKEEPFPKEYDFWSSGENRFCRSTWRRTGVADRDTYRTKLPLPTPFQFIVGQKYKTRGGGWAELREAGHDNDRYPLRFEHDDGCWSSHVTNGKYWLEKSREHRYDVLPIPYVPPKKRRVPLGPEDVPPGSAIRSTSFPKEWYAVNFVNVEGVTVGYKPYGDYPCEAKHVKFATLHDHFEIKFPNSTWQPAWKEIEE